MHTSPCSVSENNTRRMFAVEGVAVVALEFAAWGVCFKLELRVVRMALLMRGVDLVLLAGAC